MKNTLSILLFAVIAAVVMAGGAHEESTPSRNRYLASKGTITEPQEIHEDSVISYVDYRYPEPDRHPVGVYLYGGHRQLSTQGQEEVFVVGIQGRRGQLEELPPLNLAFVIDKSGSMASQDKMGWVKDSFEIFIKEITDKDFVSLVVFDNEARVVFPSTRMGQDGARRRFQQAVQAISADGGTNIIAGLRLGYEQVLSNFRKGYINRVLFLTDGLADKTGICDMARDYREIGIGVSAVGLGQGFDADLIRNLAKAGGGTSRFISDRATMEEIFGQGLGRMAVPMATDLDLEITFLPGVDIRGTWGYDHRIEGRKIQYSIPSVHMGDYETIVIQADVPEAAEPGQVVVARLEASYTNGSGKRVRMEPAELECSLVALAHPVQGYSNATVLKAASMLRYAQTLKAVGKLYYEAQGAKGKAELSGDRISEKLYRDQIQTAVDMINAVKKELINAQQRLDYQGFETEVAVLETYLSILGKEMYLGEGEIMELARDRNLVPLVEDRSMEEHVDSLFQEITLDLTSHEPGNIAVSGFSFPDGRSAAILHFLDKTAESALVGLRRYRVLERERIDAVLTEQELSLSDLMETTRAIAVGNALSADYILTGTVLEMTTSVTVFARVINVETTSIESASQIVMRKDMDIVDLLGQSRDIIELVERNEVGAVQQLIGQGIEVNRAAPDGYAPLDIAVLNGSLETLQALVNAGAELDTPRRGCTPLVLAARRNKADIVRILAGAGADPDACFEGRTALMIAVEHGYADVTAALVEVGADVEAEADGMTVLMRAIQPMNCDAASPAAVKALIEAGVDVNRVDREGYTPLMRAAVAAGPEVVKALLAAGADAAATDPGERTAAMWAEQAGNTEVAAVLRKAE